MKKPERYQHLDKQAAVASLWYSYRRASSHRAKQEAN